MTIAQISTHKKYNFHHITCLDKSDYEVIAIIEICFEVELKLLRPSTNVKAEREKRTYRFLEHF